MNLILKQAWKANLPILGRTEEEEILHLMKHGYPRGKKNAKKPKKPKPAKVVEEEEEPEPEEENEDENEDEESTATESDSD